MPRIPAKQLVTDAPVSVGSANAEGNSNAVARANHVHAHGNQSGGSLHANATTSLAGFMSAADKARFDESVTRSFFVHGAAQANVDLTALTPPTIDGITQPVSTTRYWLLQDLQTNAAERGLWFCTTDAAGVPTWTRQGFLAWLGAQTMTSDMYRAGIIVRVNGGAAASGSMFVCWMATAGFLGTHQVYCYAVTTTTGAAPAAIGSVGDRGTSGSLSCRDHVHAHGAHTDPTNHALASGAAHGFMAAADKQCLDLLANDAVAQNGSSIWIRPAIRMAVSGSSSAMTANTVFCVYMGYTLKALTISQARWFMPTVGSGADNGCQVGVGYSASAPNLSGFATVTPKALSAVGSPTVAGAKTNSSPFSLVVPAGTHLWAIVKSNLATTQMSSYPIVGDVTGSVQSKGTAGTLVVDTPIVCTAYPGSAPDLTLQAA